MASLSELLTVIITTSPVKSHPSTELLDAVRESFNLVDGLCECNQIIVADGYIVNDDGSPNKEKSGKISRELADAYEHFLVDLREKLDLEGPVPSRRLIVRSKRYGFAENLRCGVLIATTPYVLVVQHDQLFLRPLRNLSLFQIISSLVEHPEIKYLGLMSSSDMNYQIRRYNLPEYQLFRDDSKKVVHDFVRHHLQTWKSSVQSGSDNDNGNDLVKFHQLKYGLPLMPLDFWYDKPHIASRRVYLDFVFGQTHFNYHTGISVRVNNFVEDSLGNVIKSNIQHRGWMAFTMYHIYSLYDDPENPIIGHLDGRGFIPKWGSAPSPKTPMPST